MSIWEPLDADKDEIRLLKLLPSKNRGDELIAELETVSLRDRRQYEAISYAWGAPGPMKRLCVQGVRREITANLDACLRYLRGEAEPRIYWVDALCIDQRREPDSIEERGVQVSLMYRIFGEAVQVRVWTGAPEQESSVMLILQAMVMARQGSVRDVQVPVDGGRRSVLLTPSCSLLDIRIDGKGLGQRDFDDLNAFLSKPWFRRVWVQQEIALARGCVIHFGHECVDRSVMHCINANVKDLETRSQETVERFSRDAFNEHLEIFEKLRATKVALQMREQLLLHGPAGALSSSLRIFNDLLSRSRQLDVTDERDRIYGLIGLAPAQLQERVKPNYFKSKDWVYQEFALEFMRLDGHLSLFANCKYDTWRPSWVPDWSKNVTRNRIVDPFFSACGSVPLQLELEGLTKLKLSGIRVDTVARTLRKQGFGERKDDGQNFPKRYNQWRKFFGRSEQYSDVEEAYWRTLSHDIFVRRGTDIIHRATADFSLCARQAAEGVRDQKIRDFLYSVNRGAGNSALFVTQEGYFAMGCEEAEAGDQVFVLAGGQLCYVLRPVQEREHFELVGQAYAHGVMYGEAVGSREWRDVFIV